jgi:transcription elongation GreA/GreB family factor
MDKQALLKQIINTLTRDLEVLTEAAKTAHAAATHAECVPDNKYDTTGLEASYIAQGQANRAQQIRQALANYRSLTLRCFDATEPIRLTAAVTLEADDGTVRHLFLGPDSGGLKLNMAAAEYVIITPESPLGRALLGKYCDDDIVVGSGETQSHFTIVDVS